MTTFSGKNPSIIPVQLLFFRRNCVPVFNFNIRYSENKFNFNICLFFGGYSRFFCIFKDDFLKKMQRILLIPELRNLNSLSEQCE